MHPTKDKTLEKNLDVLLQKSQKRVSLSIQEILKILSGKGRAFILMFLSLPFCQPLQIPGLSTLFGILIAFIGLRMAFGKPLWLPKSILLKTVSPTAVQKIGAMILRFMKKMRRLTYPRLSCLCNQGGMRMINGFLLALLGVFLALPLPIPFTNLSVGWSIFLISIGLLKSDGVFIVLGYLVSLITILFFVFIISSIRLAF